MAADSAAVQQDSPTEAEDSLSLLIDSNGKQTLVAGETTVDGSTVRVATAADDDVRLKEQAELLERFERAAADVLDGDSR